MDRYKLKGHLAMLGANVMWGMMSPIAKMVFASGLIAPIVMVDFRVGGAAILFWITSLFLPYEHVPGKDILRLFGAGMLGVLLNQGCFILGVSLTSPGEASLVTTTMPMWVMLLAWIILREPITLKKAGGIVLGAAGAIILILGNGNNIAGDNPALGDLIVLCAQLSYALYLTLYRNFIKKILTRHADEMDVSVSFRRGDPRHTALANFYGLECCDFGGLERSWVCSCLRNISGIYLHHDRSETLAPDIGRHV